MLTKAQIIHIQNTIFSPVNFSFEGKIAVCAHTGVKVEFDGKNAVIGCCDKASLARAFFLLAMKSPQGAFSLEEKRSFDSLGVMIDLSRNRVLRVETLKRYMDHMASLGFNALMMYMEDVYEMEKYPRFGYQRGRFTIQELKEIDDYGYSLGIEVIPCVQTLGHMAQYLRWSEAGPIRDTADCLLVGAPETYEFIEEIFKTMRDAFRTDRIHLNIDETHSLGEGAYKHRFGEKEKTEIIYEHLEKVEQLCKKYGYHPIMHSDMFFRKLSPTGFYYNPVGHITKDMVSRLPEDMTICYWDYYHTEKSHYDRFMDEHKRFERPIMFYGSIWTWEGFVEDTEFTYQTSVPAMLSAMENGMKDVFISMWGDDGAETDISTTVSTLPLFSEMCYKGRECAMEELDAVSNFLTGITLSDKLALSCIHAGYHQDFFFAKRIFYTDILYDLVDENYDYAKAMADFQAAYDHASTKENDHFAYCRAFSGCLIGKLEILHRIRDAYKADDRSYLQLLADEKLPALIADYRAFRKLFSQQWLKSSKPNGLEIIENRMGAAILRLETLVERLEAYLLGETSAIEELAGEHMLSPVSPYTLPAQKVMGTSVDI